VIPISQMQSTGKFTGRRREISGGGESYLNTQKGTSLTKKKKKGCFDSSAVSAQTAGISFHIGIQPSIQQHYSKVKFISIPSFVALLHVPTKC